MSEFHLINGLTFERIPDDVAPDEPWVIIRKDGRQVARVRLSSWASAVAYTSRQSDTAEGYAAALKMLRD